MATPIARFVAMLLTPILLLSATATVGAPRQDPQVLVLGRISDDPKRHYEQLEPLLDYVVARMADLGVREGRILMARDATQMASYLRRNRVDWVTETAASGVVLAERSGARVLVATERGGVADYHSVIFTRRDSRIRDLHDLRGRSVALQNASSTSAYFAPAAALLDAGLPVEILLSPQDLPREEAVGYLFAGSENNIATWVHKRLVDAGAFSNLDWEDPRRLPQRYRDDLRVIHRTAEYPRALELVRADLEPVREARLREILLAAADDPDGREALLHFFGTTRFLPVDEALTTSLERLADDVRRVKAALE